MPTDLLSQIEAAAAMGAIAKRTRCPEAALPPPEWCQFYNACEDLPLSAIAEELRTARAAREAAERERDIQIQGNCRLSNDLEAATADRDRLAAECESLRAVVERQEQSEEKMCVERDDAEQALSQAYYIVIGRSPEWSNLFGHKEALADIKDAADTLREAARLAGKGGSQ